MKRRKRRQRDSSVEASYVCDVCGEEIVIPVEQRHVVRMRIYEYKTFALIANWIGSRSPPKPGK